MKYGRAEIKVGTEIKSLRVSLIPETKEEENDLILLRNEVDSPKIYFRSDGALMFVLKEHREHEECSKSD